MKILLLESALLFALLTAPSGAQGLGFAPDFAGNGPAGFGSYALAVHDDGTGPQLYVGGEFTQVHGSPYYFSQNIVRWNGSAWSSVGWGVTGGSEPRGVFSLAVYDAGNGPMLYAGGRFDWVGSPTTGWVPGSWLARWDGQEWWPLISLQGGGRVLDMVVFDDGTGPQLYIASGGVHRWNGLTLAALGAFWINTWPWEATVPELCIHDDGSGPKLYASGRFDFVDGQPSNGLVRWDGTQWKEVDGTPCNGMHVTAMESYDDGNGPALYYACGRLWQLRGGVWTAHGVRSPDALCVFDDGNGPALFAAGRMLEPPAGPSPGTRVLLSRWDGQSWQSVGVPSLPVPTAQYPAALATYDFGEGQDLYMAGYLSLLGGQPSHNLARFRGTAGLIARVCGGDGSLSKCPCNTRGAEGRGCPNSAESDGALLRASGTAASDTLRFHAGGLPASAATLLFQGSAYDYTSSFLGDGVRCTTGNVLRLFAEQASQGASVVPGPGDPTVRARAAELGDLLTAGSVRYYQLWYRDADPDFCASGGPSNVTNGLRVVW